MSLFTSIFNQENSRNLSHELRKPCTRLMCLKLYTLQMIAIKMKRWIKSIGLCANGSRSRVIRVIFSHLSFLYSLKSIYSSASISFSFHHFSKIKRPKKAPSSEFTSQWNGKKTPSIEIQRSLIGCNLVIDH